MPSECCYLNQAYHMLPSDLEFREPFKIQQDSNSP